MMVYSREKISFEDVKYNLQTKLHLDNEMIIIEKGDQGVSLVTDRGRSKEKILKDSRSIRCLDTRILCVILVRRRAKLRMIILS
jgi:hypothetical protein